MPRALMALALGLALLAGGGCASERAIGLDAKEPSISVRTSGIYLDNEPSSIAEVVERLEDSDIPKTRTVHILLDGEVRDLTEARTLMGVLAASGYTRPVLVTKRHADSEAIDQGKRRQSNLSATTGRQSGGQRQIRYRGGNE